MNFNTNLLYNAAPLISGFVALVGSYLYFSNTTYPGKNDSSLDVPSNILLSICPTVFAALSTLAAQAVYGEGYHHNLHDL